MAKKIIKKSIKSLTKNSTLDAFIGDLEKGIKEVNKAIKKSKLPHFKSDPKTKTNLEPVYIGCFEVIFENSSLTKTELKILKDSVTSYVHSTNTAVHTVHNENIFIHFNLNLKKEKGKFKIIPYDILLKLSKAKTSTTIKVNQLTKNNEIFFTKVLNNCAIEFNENCLISYLGLDSFGISTIDFIEIKVFPEHFSKPTQSIKS